MADLGKLLAEGSVHNELLMGGLHYAQAHSEVIVGMPPLLTPQNISQIAEPNNFTALDDSPGHDETNTAARSHRFRRNNGRKIHEADMPSRFVSWENTAA